VDAFNRVNAAQLSQNVVRLSSRFSGIRSGTLHQIDLSALKKFTIHERLDFELRAEFLNAFNAVYLSTPNTSPTSAAFGTVTAENGAPRNVILSLRARF
jgi:outer membrane receptor protein involved in Fe transport